MSDKQYDFKMSGGLGDIIYALPTMRALGGGHLAICPSKHTDNFLHSADQLVSLRPFQGLDVLLGVGARDYLKSVDLLAAEVPARYDLNEFRLRPSLYGPPSLAQMMLEQFKCDPLAWQKRPWLSVTPANLQAAAAGEVMRHDWTRDKALRGGSIVLINRTLRYHNRDFPWRAVLERYRDQTYFVGTPEEHAIFLDDHAPFYVPRRHTETILELALWIRAALMFVGNQSLAFALAVALERPAVLEQCERCPNCNYAPYVTVNPTAEQVMKL